MSGPPEESESTAMDVVPIDASDLHAFVSASRQAGLSSLEQEKAKIAARASRFNVPAHIAEKANPAALLSHLDKKRLAWNEEPGFITGIDLETPEEIAKREARAQKFQAQLGAVAGVLPAVGPAGGAGAGPAAPVVLTERDLKKYEERRDGREGAEVRPEAIYLYSVDDLSSKDILKLFVEYGADFVEWVNDSSCVVVFAEAATTRRAMLGLGAPVLVKATPRDPALAIIDQMGISLEPMLIAPPIGPPAAASAPLPELEGPFSNPPPPVTHDAEANPWRGLRGTRLTMRFATLEDVRPLDSKPSRYYGKIIRQINAKKAARAAPYPSQPRQQQNPKSLRDVIMKERKNKD
jgi:hypothetical protein